MGGDPHRLIHKRVQREDPLLEDLHLLTPGHPHILPGKTDRTGKQMDAFGARPQARIRGHAAQQRS